MKPWLKRLLTILSVLMLVVCGFCCAYIYQYFRGASLNRDLQELAAAVPTETGTAAAETEAPESPAGEESIPETGVEEIPTMTAAVDFTALQEVNEEIYAYLEIPGTSIHYPVVQSAEDDLYYNNHAADKSYYTGGSIYSQRYNTKTFEDPHTVLYGHNMRSGDMFGLLGNYADADYYQEHPTIYIHTPEQVFEYQVFAACLHGNEHLLANYDFSDPAVFEEFFTALTEEETLSGNFTRERFPEAGDQVLTLSTCHGSNRNLRFLVMAVLTETYTIVSEAAGQ